jgi:hypothetical protein
MHGSKDERSRLKPALEIESLRQGFDRDVSSSPTTVSSRCDLLSVLRPEDASFHRAHARARAENETDDEYLVRPRQLLLVVA